jgi:7-carboxy-7-deazaguanine synthase
LVGLNFTHHLLQPLDDAHNADHVADCMDVALADPRWRLSLQTHKIVGLR